MDAIKRMAASGGSYLTLYLVLMVPTYLLPYVGSNSFLAQGVNADYAHATGNSGIFIYFLLHWGRLVRWLYWHGRVERSLVRAGSSPFRSWPQSSTLCRDSQ